MTMRLQIGFRIGLQLELTQGTVFHDSHDPGQSYKSLLVKRKYPVRQILLEHV